MDENININHNNTEHLYDIPKTIIVTENNEKTTNSHTINEKQGCLACKLTGTATGLGLAAFCLYERLQVPTEFPDVTKGFSSSSTGAAPTSSSSSSSSTANSNSRSNLSSAKLFSLNKIKNYVFSNSKNSSTILVVNGVEWTPRSSKIHRGLLLGLSAVFGAMGIYRALM